MKKRIFALLLCAVLILPALPAANAAFTDISDPETSLAAATLQGLGIVAGTSANSFTPNNSLTRAEACALIINTMGLSNQVNTYKQRTVFSDVLPSAWYTGIVNLAYAQGIVNGYGNGTFGPEDKVTYGHFATMLLRLLGYSTAEIGSVWPLDYTAFCDNLGLSEGLGLQPAQVLTRGQAAVLLYRTLKANANSSSKPYYTTLSGVAATAEVILLDNNASYGGTDGLLKVCSTTGSGGVTYYGQAKPQSDALLGTQAAVLLDSAGDVLGAIPLKDDALEHKVTSAKEVILLDTDATYEGTSGLLKASPLDGSSGAVYYTQVTKQNSSLTDSAVTLLLDGAGQVVGMFAGSETYPSAQIAAQKQALLLDVNAALGSETGLLMAYELEGTPGIAYYNQAVPQQGALTGTVVSLLLDKRGDVVAVAPQSTGYRDVTVASAKTSGIIDSDGVTHRINANAATIVGGSAYNWSSTGYIQINSRPGKIARLFYNDGAVTYVYLTTGAADADTQVAMAQTDSAASELARKLGISGSYSITKNGMAAQADDLGRYDVAYYDKNSKTLCASDYQLSGFIQSVSPSLDAAQSITVSGCTVPVLESAWTSLSDYALGDRVTLLLTDDGKVTMATSDNAVTTDMVGVLSTDGKSVTLVGSGLKVTAKEVSADAKLYGRLVRVYVAEDSISCYSYTSDITGEIDIIDQTLGKYELAASCSIYEHAGGSYLYSLSGQLGVASRNFDDIFWTDTIETNRVDFCRVNSAGKVDLIVLKNVTGNCYEYGKTITYSDSDGIRMDSSAAWAVYSKAVTLTNGEGVSKKYLSAYSVNSLFSYQGIALHSYSSSYQEVTSMVTLSRVAGLGSSVFFLQGEDWYATVNNREIPVSENVQVYIESTDRWLSGAEGVSAAIASGAVLEVHHDQTLATGAQVRVIVVNQA